MHKRFISRRDGGRLLFLALLTLVSIVPAAQAAAGQTDVAAALDSLDAWLAGSSFGPGWHKYLHTDSLRNELAEGSDADPRALMVVLSWFKSDVPGLERPRFVAVRTALEAWLADLEMPTVDELPEIALEAKDQFREISADDVAAAKQSAIDALDDLNNYLARNPRYARGWKKFLNWDELQTELAKDDPDLTTLNAVVEKLSSDNTGLEKRRFLLARRLLNLFVNRQRVHLNTEAARQAHEKVATELAEQLKNYSAASSHFESLQIAQRLAFLERYGQDTGLVRAVRHYYAYPNLVAYIHGDVATAGMDNEIDEPSVIRDSIQGAYVVSRGRTTGAVIAELIPDEARAVFELQMTGVNKSRSTASSRRVQVYSNATTQLNASKRLYFDEEGLTSDPASGRASTSSHFTGVSAPRAFVERIAWKKAYQKKGAAEAEAARKAARRLRNRVDEQAAEQLADPNEKYLTKFRNPLLRREAFPELFDIHTDADFVSVKLLQAAEDQLAAPVPPGPPPADADMAVRLHESVINNFAAAFLGGKTLVSENTPPDIIEKLKEMGEDVQIVKKDNEQLDKLSSRREERLAEFCKAYGDPVPPKVEKQQDEDKWFGITLARSDPFSVEFRDGKIKFVLRGTRFLGPQIDSPKDAPANQKMSIWAIYNVEHHKYGGLQLTLQEWDVDPTSKERGGKTGLGGAATRAKLRARFAEQFFEGKDGELKTRLVLPLELPGKWQKVGDLAYTVFDSKEGWLSVAWNRQPKEKQAAKPTTPVAKNAESQERKAESQS